MSEMFGERKETSDCELRARKNFRPHPHTKFVETAGAQHRGVDHVRTIRCPNDKNLLLLLPVETVQFLAKKEKRGNQKVITTCDELLINGGYL